ncbi:glycosyltransferase family 2 protein [Pedobacter jejuensis]|uniref:Glycosyltransferase family 2 protein n=1 Tax=Pedobacter jejuensis TaxID=1268550 RepID=A0A3N0C3P7_9SPHI|nr:glycosyltransferase family 2 protein [Pedobacter jejuensis]RNL56909.1 glycosyltransferase family 2 protein [Pedobacter jejuensis]
MKISVCLATFNGSKYIKEQLISIASQIKKDDEIIISDDQSSDDTIQIIESFNDDRIKIFINEGERGYSKNFENAISKSSGDILFISDQDDVWMNNKVIEMVDALKNATLVMHDALIVDGELNVINQSHFELYKVKRGFWNNFLKTRYIGACIAFRREILDKALPFPSNQKLCAYDYWLTIISEYYYKVELLDKPLIRYRRHGSNASTGGMLSQNSTYHKLKVRFYSLYNLLNR